MAKCLKQKVFIVPVEEYEEKLEKIENLQNQIDSLEEENRRLKKKLTDTLQNNKSDNNYKSKYNDLIGSIESTLNQFK